MKKRKPAPRKKRGGKRKKRISKNIRIALLLLLLAMGLFVVYLFSNDLPGSCGEPAKQGIDVSHHQGEIDWSVVAKENNISFVYIKASEGATLQDSKHHYNTTQAQEVGLPVGSYHYFHPNAPVAAQYENFMNVVSQHTQELIPVIDIEERGGLTNTQICDSLQKFSDMLTLQWGVRPIIYCDQNYYNRTLHPQFSNHTLWIARYGVLKLRRQPSLHGGKEHSIWQYSKQGSIEGIKGHVDLNCLNDKIELNDIKLLRNL